MLEIREFSFSGSGHEFKSHEVDGQEVNVAFGIFTVLAPDDGFIRFEGNAPFVRISQLVPLDLYVNMYYTYYVEIICRISRCLLMGSC